MRHMRNGSNYSKQQHVQEPAYERTAVAERPRWELVANGVRVDRLRAQLPWPILLWRALERPCPVEREWFRRYRFGETAGGRDNGDNS
jgi:hypothetical protein